MKLIEQLLNLETYRHADVIIVDEWFFKHNIEQEAIHQAHQLLVINTELHQVNNWLANKHLANVIVATYDQDYWNNLSIVKRLEENKIGVLCLKESMAKQASIESLLKTLSSLQFKSITCILSKNKVTEFLTNFNPAETHFWQDNNLVAEKLLGANTLLPHLNLNLVVV